MRKIIISIAIAAIAALAAGPVSAAAPAEPSCWGVVSAQRATADGGLGEHSSSQETPRLGLGNVARLILGPDAHVSDLGTVLAELDEFEETSCG
jgi:hypothetical protein